MGEFSFVGEPASARPSRFEMEGNVHLILDSMGGEGGGLAKLCCCPTGYCDTNVVILDLR